MTLPPVTPPAFSRNRSFRSSHCALFRALLIGTAIGASVSMAVPARAQSAVESSRTWNIPSGPLDTALARFAAEAGVNLSFETQLVAGRHSAGVSGEHTVASALARLLDGTGLKAERSAAGVFLLQRVSGEVAVLPAVKVQVAGAQLDELPEAYAGGQVARGGQLGVLGNRDVMDTPFSQSSYTAQLMRDQQARTLGDVLKYDSSVREQHGAIGDFKIRGFTAFNSEFLFGGLMGVTPTLVNLMAVETLERIEVLKGPSAVLNGAGTNANIGGSINVVPKRAGSEPVTQLTGSYNGESQAGLHVDIGRRFGADGQFGARANGLVRKGDTPIDRQTEHWSTATLGLDYRGTIARASFDIGYVDRDQRGTRTGVSLAPGVAVPKAPKASVNYNNPWNHEESQTTYGALRGEFDLGDHATAFAAYGFNDRVSQNARESRTVTNAAGDIAAGNAQLSGDRWEGRTTQVGIRGEFSTGPVQHHPVLAHNTYRRDGFRTRPNYAIPASNLYEPVFAPAPGSMPDPDSAPLLQRLKLESTSLANTFSVLDEQVQLTLGLRDQTIEVITSAYDRNKVTSVAGLVVKPRRDISIYANYAEGLQQGPTAPASAVNAGEVFEPFVSKQYEAGVKFDFGHLMATVSVFQIAQPSGIIDPATNRFGIDGEQRHRGLEVSAQGAPVAGTRLLAGLTLIDSELTRTTGGVNDGKHGPGVPAAQANVGAEWDAPVTGLTLFGTVIITSSQYINPANTQRIDGWERLDLGLRYTTRAFGHSAALRASVENVFNKSYWANAAPALELNAPRTLLLSTTVDF